MRPIDADALKTHILEERKKIPVTIPTAYYELVKEKPNTHGNSMRGGIRIALRCMEETPTLTLDDIVPHGRWVAQNEGRTRFMCSNCESKNYGGHENYCPNCGARMIGGTE